MLCKVFYANRAKSSAVQQPQYFGESIPLQTLAAVLTAIKAVITEYDDGTHVHKVFFATKYQPVYENFLEDLRNWHAFTEARGTRTTQHLLDGMLKFSRDYAGVTNENVTDLYWFSQAEFEADE